MHTYIHTYTLYIHTYKHTYIHVLTQWAEQLIVPQRIVFATRNTHLFCLIQHTWIDAVMRIYSGESAYWWISAVMRIYSGESAYWWVDAVMRIYNSESAYWWVDAVMRIYSGESAYWWVDAVMRINSGESAWRSYADICTHTSSIIHISEFIDQMCTWQSSSPTTLATIELSNNYITSLSSHTSQSSSLFSPLRNMAVFINTWEGWCIVSGICTANTPELAQLCGYTVIAAQIYYWRSYADIQRLQRKFIIGAVLRIYSDYSAY